MPIWRYAAVIVPLGDRLAEAIAFKGSVIDSEGIDHFRVVDGNGRDDGAGAGGMTIPRVKAARRRDPR